MKHINTKSAAEADARTKYAEAREGFVVASEDLEKKVAELLALRHKMDEDELLKSQLMGEIMDEMKSATVLANKAGSVIATWKAAPMKSAVDYKGLLKHLKATKEDIAAYTNTKLGARTFELIEDQAECEDAIKNVRMPR